MKVLALDTACATASCAVSENGQLLAEAAIHGTRTHSQKLLPMAADLLGQMGMTPADMDAFAVSVGPGSFTGLRIGVVTGKGLAFATGRPLIGVSTLEALAFTIPFWKGLVCPVVDARNLQAFCGFYSRGARAVTPLAEDRVLPVEALADALAAFGQEVLMVGDCAARFVPLVRERWTRTGSALEVYDADPVLFTTRAAASALLAEQRLHLGAPGDPMQLEPLYMRASQAERLRKEGP